MLRVALFAAVAFVGLSSAASAQSASLKAELLRDWQEMKTTIRALAEAMPEDRYTYKSTPPQRDFGQQVLHIAGANVNNLRFLGGKAAAPTINRMATRKAEIIQQMDASFDYGTALINEFDDATLMQIV